MIYPGGKHNLSKRILPLILKNRKPEQHYVEPFVGGANVFKNVSNPRIGSDIHLPIISYYQETQKGWTPPRIDRQKFEHMKNQPENFKPHELGFYGHGYARMGEYFGTFVDKQLWHGDGYTRDRIQAAHNSHDILYDQIKGALFICVDYLNLLLPNNSLIYCDPPYENGYAYNGKHFDSPLFWKWVRNKTKEGHEIFISEYKAPSDFICIYAHETYNHMGAKQKRIEKLFVHESQRI